MQQFFHADRTEHNCTMNQKISQGEYEQSVCQMGVKNANTKVYITFWRTSQKIPTCPSKNLYQLIIQDETCIHNFGSKWE